MANERIVRIRLDSKSAESQSRRLNKSVKDVGASADRSSGSMLSLSRAAAAVAAALSVTAVTRYADAWTRLNNQIKQTTTDTRQALAIQEAIFTIAKESRVELGGVAEAYQRISNSVAEFGFSSKEVLDVTEGLTKAFKANGATAQEASSVLVQLGQALGSGALQGEELRAILEASLPVSKAIAREFGVTTGELKKLGAEGQLTTERVFNALQQALPQFESAFDRANVTIAEGLDVAGNSITRLIGEISDATGASEAFAGGLVELSNSIDFLSDAVASGAAGEIAGLFRSQLNQITSDVNQTITTISSLWNSLGIEITSSTTDASTFVGDAFLNIIPNVRTLVQVITVELAAAADKLKVYGEAVLETLNPFDDVSVDQARGNFSQREFEINKVREAALQAIFDERVEQEALQRQFIENSKAKVKAYREEREARSQALTSGEIGAPGGSSGDSPNGATGGGDAGGGRPSGGGDANLTARLERENQMIQQSLLNRQIIYRDFFSAANELRQADFEQQNNQLSLNLALQQQQEYEAFQQRLAQITDRQLQIAENESLTEIQRQEAKALLDEQAILARQQFENRITEIAQEGAAERARIEQQEAVNRINTFQGYANTALKLGEAFGSKSEKSQKKRRKAAVVIDTAAGISRAFAENNFYVALGMSAFLAANGLAQIKAIDSAGQGSSIKPPTGGAAGLGQATQPSQNNQQQQRRIVDLRGFETGGFLTREQLTSLLENDEDVILANNNGQQQGARVGLING